MKLAKLNFNDAEASVSLLTKSGNAYSIVEQPDGKSHSITDARSGKSRMADGTYILGGRLYFATGPSETSVSSTIVGIFDVDMYSQFVRLHEQGKLKEFAEFFIPSAFDLDHRITTFNRSHTR
ncbi:MAG: hypothetical protein FWE53_02080 [Firmicutes bacterium]|nr:hypothetical protein [Bacillota bacterium]